MKTDLISSSEIDFFFKKILPHKVLNKINPVYFQIINKKTDKIMQPQFFERIFIDPIYMEECAKEVVLKQHRNKIIINIYPLKLYKEKTTIIKALILHQIAKNYLTRINRKEKKYLYRVFQYYPIEFYRTRNRNFLSNKGNYKKSFYYHFVVFFMKQSFSQKFYPFTFFNLNSFFYNIENTSFFQHFKIRLKHNYNRISLIKTPKGLFADHSKQIKNLLFNYKKRVLDKEFNSVFQIEKLINLDQKRIFGISLLIAGEEGKHSLGVGHSGLVILVADPGSSLKECLQNTKEHIVFNPMGDTYLYEHSPVRKIIAGGLRAKFPLIYHLEYLSSYVDKLTNFEHRDVYISPPIITRKRPLELNLALMQISEMVNSNKTKGYNFFKESCVHVCKNVLSIGERLRFFRKKHSLSQFFRILPHYPIAIWNYYYDDFRRNSMDSSLNKEMKILWEKYNKLINRYVFTFRYSNAKKNRKTLLELIDLKLLFLAKDDGLSTSSRKKQSETTKRMSSFFNAIDLEQDSDIFNEFCDDILTVKEYVSISPLKRLELIFNIIESYNTKEDQRKILQRFLKIEQRIFMRLDQFFEQTKIFHDFLGKFIKSKTFAYHFRCNLDLTMDRPIDQTLTPFNLYSYLIMHDKIVRKVTRL